MFKSLKNFFLSQKYFSVISLFLTAYLGIFSINHFANNPVLDIFQLIGGIFFMVVGSGISIVLITQGFLRRNFDQWEFVSLSFLSGIIIFPSILEIEYVLLGKVYDWYPLANILVFWFGAGAVLFLKKTFFPSFSFTLKSLFEHPVFIMLIISSAFTAFQIFSFRALADLDPYKWLFKYTYQFVNGQLDYAERPFFGSFVFIGTRLTGLSIFNLFKYVFPFIFLSSFFPAWMVARYFDETRKRWLFLLFLFASPVVILYAETSIPQTILITLSYFFVFFLFNSLIKNDEFFFYSAGITMLLAFFYHQSAVIALTAWAIITIAAKRKRIFSDKKTTVLIILLILTNLSRLGSIYEFMRSWLSTVVSSIFRGNNLNLLYPAQYTNIDLSVMGWGSITGVMKFYAFYMGPVVGGIFLLFLGILILNPDFRSFLAKKELRNPGISIIALSFILFFAIAEIFPRFLNLSLLPDRAWIFCGIFSLIFIFVIFRFAKKIPAWSIGLFAILFLVNISGTIYVNYLKRHLITPAQWQSAEWIEKNLPENRIFLSYGYKNLLPVHADTPLIKIPSEVYCGKNIDDFRAIVNDNDPAPKDFVVKYHEFLEDTKGAINNNFLTSYMTDRKTIDENRDTIAKTAELLNGIAGLQSTLKKKEGALIIIYPISRTPELNSPISIENVYKYNTVDSLKENPLYIYYSRENEKNPYRYRPYDTKNWGIDPCPDGKFLFDLYPEKFERIYSTRDKEVIIWKII